MNIEDIFDGTKVHISFMSTVHISFMTSKGLYGTRDSNLTKEK